LHGTHCIPSPESPKPLAPFYNFNDTGKKANGFKENILRLTVHQSGLPRLHIRNNEGIKFWKLKSRETFEEKKLKYSVLFYAFEVVVFIVI
jgi:hypothetical protein